MFYNDAEMKVVSYDTFTWERVIHSERKLICLINIYKVIVV